MLKLTVMSVVCAALLQTPLNAVGIKGTTSVGQVNIAIPYTVASSPVTTEAETPSADAEASLAATAFLLPGELPEAGREAHRLLAFEGASNFRDIGGYTTVDGRRIRWGLLYRSDNLAKLSDTDLSNLARLQLKTIIDFRFPDEVEEDPNRLPEGVSIKTVSIPIPHPANVVELIPEDKRSEIRELFYAGDMDNFTAKLDE